MSQFLGMKLRNLISRFGRAVGRIASQTEKPVEEIRAERLQKKSDAAAKKLERAEVATLNASLQRASRKEK